MSPSNVLFRRLTPNLSINHHPSITALSCTYKLYRYHQLQPFSTENTAKLKSKSSAKTKQKYTSSIYGKTKGGKSKSKKNDNNTDLYSSVSATDYDKDLHPTGWNAVFHKCHALLEYSPHGTKEMMHSFNTLVTSNFFSVFICLNSSGAVCWASIYALSYYGVYSFPASWFFAWLTIRVFTDIFPLFPAFQCGWVEKYAFKEFPILKQLRFSRKLPDPELQSFSAMMQDRLDEQKRLKYKKEMLDKGKKEKWKDVDQDLDIEDMPFTDEMIAKSNAIASWKIRQRQYAKKYGLAYDIVENCSTLVFMPMFMVLFQVTGISDPLINALLSQSTFWSNNQWIVTLGVSYSVSTYLARLISIPVLRSYSLPKYYNKFGPL